MRGGGVVRSGGVKIVVVYVFVCPSGLGLTGTVKD